MHLGPVGWQIISISITSHAPLLFGGFANKLRGFEVSRETDHILLLDSDMLVLSDIGDLPSALGTDCIAASAANGPCLLKLPDINTFICFHSNFKRQGQVR